MASSEEISVDNPVPRNSHIQVAGIGSTVSTSSHENSAQRRPWGEKANALPEDIDRIEFKVNPETFRIAAYVGFWFMVIFAIFITKIFVDPALLDNSVLIDTFGYNNICVYWDYSPSRELAAVVYPLFVEAPLVAYLVLNAFRAAHAYYQQKISKALFVMEMCVVPLCAVAMVWCRMIFVVISEENIIGHTVGFFILQAVLLLMALVDMMYHRQVKTWHGTLVDKFHLDKLYVAACLLVTPAKMTISIALFVGLPIVNTKTASGARFAQGLDIMWMLLNAVIPLTMAIYFRKATPGIAISLDMDTIKEVTPAKELAVLSRTERPWE